MRKVRGACVWFPGLQKNACRVYCRTKAYSGALTYANENTDLQKLPSSNSFRGIEKAVRASLFPLLRGLPACRYFTLCSFRYVLMRQRKANAWSRQCCLCEMMLRVLICRLHLCQPHRLEKLEESPEARDFCHSHLWSTQEVKSFFTVIITKKMMELLWTLKTRSCLSYWSAHLQKPTLVFGRVSVWQLNSMLFYHRLQELCLLVAHMINKCSREHFPMYQCASIRGGREKEAPVTSLNNFGKCTLSTEDNTKYTWFPFFKS